jgi:hypothetical protein
MKVTIHLSALTRVFYDKEIEVPDGTTEDELDDLVKTIQDETDGGEYTDDIDYWENGQSWWEVTEEGV